MRTRIVFLLDQLNLAGAQKRAFNLARSLDPSRFEVQIIALNAGGPLQSEIEAAGIDLRILSFHEETKRLRNLVEIWRLARILRELSPSIVHTFFYWSSVYGTIACRLASVPILITSRTGLYSSQPKGPIFRLIEHIINPLATSVLTISRAVKHDTIHDEGIPEHKVELIYNGVEIGPISKLEDREGFRRSLGISPDDSVVVMVANFSAYKRHDTLLEAARAVLRERPDTKFLMVGRESAHLDLLKQMTREFGIDDAVCWTGVRSDIPDILGISDIGVLCSETEALGNAILEYMDAGLPVIGTRVGGIPEIVNDGETGWLIAVGDAQALGHHLLELLADPDRARQMGAAGGERVRTTFGLEKMVRGYARIYESLLERSGLR